MPLPLLLSNTLIKYTTDVKCKSERVKARDDIKGVNKSCLFLSFAFWKD